MSGLSNCRSHCCHGLTRTGSGNALAPNSTSRFAASWRESPRSMGRHSDALICLPPASGERCSLHYRSEMIISRLERLEQQPSRIANPGRQGPHGRSYSENCCRITSAIRTCQAHPTALLSHAPVHPCWAGQPSNRIGPRAIASIPATMIPRTAQSAWATPPNR